MSTTGDAAGSAALFKKKAQTEQDRARQSKTEQDEATQKKHETNRIWENPISFMAF